MTTPPSSPRPWSLAHNTPSKKTPPATLGLKRPQLALEEDEKAAVILQCLQTHVGKRHCPFRLESSCASNDQVRVDSETCHNITTSHNDEKVTTVAPTVDVSATVDKAFSNLKSALHYFETNTNAVGAFKCKNGTFMVRQLVRPDGKPNMSTWGDHDWLIVRCEHKGNAVLMKLYGITPVHRASGSSRRIYNISDDLSVHLKHFTCTRMGESRKCSACKHTEWKIKCSDGLAVFKLRYRH